MSTDLIVSYGERLRALLLEAAADGVQLAIPVIEPVEVKPIKDYCQYQAFLTIPIRYHHHFYNLPLYVVAKAMMGVDAQGESAALKPLDLLTHTCSGPGAELYTHIPKRT